MGMKTKNLVAAIGATILVLGVANALGYFGNALVDPRHAGIWIGIGLSVMGLTMFGEYLKG